MRTVKSLLYQGNDSQSKSLDKLKCPWVFLYGRILYNSDFLYHGIKHSNQLNIFLQMVWLLNYRSLPLIERSTMTWERICCIFRAWALMSSCENFTADGCRNVAECKGCRGAWICGFRSLRGCSASCNGYGGGLIFWWCDSDPSVLILKNKNEH